MVDAATEAITFVGEFSFAEFRQNRMMVQAVVRSLEIVGEAANQLTSDFKNKNPEIDWRTIIGMRNRLIHAYFDIDYQVVWKTVKEDLPSFIEQLKILLAKTSK